MPLTVSCLRCVALSIQYTVNLTSIFRNAHTSSLLRTPSDVQDNLRGPVKSTTKYTKQESTVLRYSPNTATLLLPLSYLFVFVYVRSFDDENNAVDIKDVIYASVDAVGSVVDGVVGLAKAVPVAVQTISKLPETISDTRKATVTKINKFQEDVEGIFIISYPLGSVAVYL